MRTPWGVFLRSMAVWVLVALPFSPSIYALFRLGRGCFGPQPPGLEQSALGCLGISAVIAPFAAVFGPLSKDESPPINLWPGILLTALVIGALMASVRFGWRFYSPRTPDGALGKPGQG